MEIVRIDTAISIVDVCRSRFGVNTVVCKRVCNMDSALELREGETIFHELRRVKVLVFRLLLCLRAWI